MKYILVIAGVILMIYGGYMIVNAARNIAIKEETPSESNGSEVFLPKATYLDQHGNKIDLSGCKGKYILLNFTTTWCGYCLGEIPAYLEFSKMSDEYVCFYVMNSYTSGVSKEDIIKYTEDNEIDIPVIIDEDNVLYGLCAPQGYPTLYIVDKEGRFLGYFAGALDEEGFERMLEAAKTYE